MTQRRLVRLDFGRNPVHFGEVGIGIEETAERVRSDTLFSALMSSYVKLYGVEAVEKLLEQFPPKTSHPPFRLSSTFIYRCLREDESKKTTQTQGAISQCDRIIDYLPRPLHFPKGFPSTPDIALSKVFKTLSYIPLSLWQRWYQGAGITHADLEELRQSTLQPTKGELAMAGLFDYRQTYHLETTPKVAVDRISHATNFYHTGFIKYNHQPQDSSGLYFLIEFLSDDNDLESRLYGALNFLGEEGLGGERSSGAGQFEILNWTDLNPSTSDLIWNSVLNYNQGNHFNLLSLFWNESLDPNLISGSTRYEFKERGGWAVGVQARRKMVRMFTEGSTFPVLPAGQLADVTPKGFKERKNGHTIYRSGISFSVPISVGDD